MMNDNPTVRVSKRKVAHLTFPLVLETAFGQEKDVLDRSPDGDRLTHVEHAGLKWTILREVI